MDTTGKFIAGKIIVALPEQSGTSRSGNPWKKREYVVETADSTYPRRMAFTLFGERADQYPLTVGQQVKVYFDIDAHEYNGRWYNEIRAWKVENEVAGAAAPAAPAAAPAQGPGVPPPPPVPQAGAEDDLPF